MIDSSTHWLINCCTLTDALRIQSSLRRERDGLWGQTRNTPAKQNLKETNIELRAGENEQGKLTWTPGCSLIAPLSRKTSHRPLPEPQSRSLYRKLCQEGGLRLGYLRHTTWQQELFGAQLCSHETQAPTLDDDTLLANKVCAAQVLGKASDEVIPRDDGLEPRGRTEGVYS